MPFQFGIHLDAELRRLVGDVDVRVPEPVLRELEGLADSERHARTALRLAGAYPPIEGHGSPDDALLELATSRAGIVVTNDAALLERLRQARVPVIFLRSRNHLVVEGL